VPFGVDVFLVRDRTDEPVTKQHRGDPTSSAARLGERQDSPAGTPRHLAQQINDRWQEAADVWHALDRPYERALALIEVSTPAAQTQAFDILDCLGAGPAAALAAERLRSLGGRVPRRARPSTLANPAGLTSREIEALQLVVDGLTNPEIAVKLFVLDNDRRAPHISGTGQARRRQPSPPTRPGRRMTNSLVVR
jgi:regulatory LuxR family protein